MSPGSDSARCAGGETSVSVILTTYNRSAYLAEAIDSVLAQSFTDFELLIVDDGSSDPEPRQVAMEYAKQDQRVRAIALKKNVGLSAARNHGIEKARGPYIAFQDDDDLSAPQRLASQVEFLEANPNYGAVRSAFVVFGNGTPTRLVAPDSPLRMRAGTSVTTAGFLDDFNHLFPGSPMSLMRRQLLLDLGGFRSWFRKSEVWDLALRILEVADLATIPELGYYYRQHSLERLTSTTDIYMYYGTAFLCALYREMGRPEPIGKQEDAELTPLAPLAPLAPLFKELPSRIKASVVDYALGHSVAAALDADRHDIVLRIQRELLAFADKDDHQRIGELTGESHRQNWKKRPVPAELQFKAQQLQRSYREGNYAEALRIYRALLPLGDANQRSRALIDLMLQLHLRKEAPDISADESQRQLDQLLLQQPLSLDFFPVNRRLTAARVKQMMRHRQFRQLRRELALHKAAADEPRFRQQHEKLRRKAIKYAITCFRPMYLIS